MRKFNIFTSLLAVGALSFSAVPAATASEVTSDQDSRNNLTEAEETELREFFDTHNVDDSVQNDLISSFEAGEPWDSMSGEDPANVDVTIVNGVTTEIERFSDGSVVVSTTDTPQEADQGSPDMSPRSVSSCQFISGNRYSASYRNCFAEVNFGVIRMGFYFDRETYNQGQGTITAARGMEHDIYGGALSNHRLIRMSDSQIRYAADFSVAFQGFPVGWTAWMQANQGVSTNAWTTYNW